jgi:hypothetical protein
VRYHLDQARKPLSLELRWEIDEVLEAIQPPPAPPPPAAAPEPEPEAPADGKLRVSAPNTQQAEVAVDPKSTNLILIRSVSPLSPLVVTAIRLK